MFKRLLLCLFLLGGASRAIATDYTDIYSNTNAAKTGYGFNVVQSDTFLFVTFFIYGPDNKPTWYTAQLTLDSSGNFNGGLYATTGTYYGLPWNPSDHPPAVQVGTASFQPTSAYTANLVYVVTGPPIVTVTEALQRQTLTAITLGGNYFGGQSGAYSGCSNPSQNSPYTDPFDLQVTQLTDGHVTFQFTYHGSGLTCTLTGTLTQYGQLYTVPTTNYSCSDGLNTNAHTSEIKATSLGIEGRFVAPMEPLTGCREEATFAGVLH